MKEGPMIMELAKRSGNRLVIAEPCNSPHDLVQCRRCAPHSHCEHEETFPVPDPGFCIRGKNYTLLLSWFTDYMQRVERIIRHTVL